MGSCPPGATSGGLGTACRKRNRPCCAYMRSMDEAVMTAPAPEPMAPGAEAPPGFESFFELRHERLFRALWLVTRNRHEAEELTQDAFLKVWQRWDRVGGGADPV